MTGGRDELSGGEKGEEGPDDFHIKITHTKRPVGMRALGLGLG